MKSNKKSKKKKMKKMMTYFNRLKKFLKSMNKNSHNFIWRVTTTFGFWNQQGYQGVVA